MDKVLGKNTEGNKSSATVLLICWNYEVYSTIYVYIYIYLIFNGHTNELCIILSHSIINKNFEVIILCAKCTATHLLIFGLLTFIQ